MKKDNRTEALRRKIFSEATSVLQAKGYADTTMEDIAKAAGTSKGNVYNYFSSKRDLFESLLRDQAATKNWVKPGLLKSSLPATEKLRELVWGILHGIGNSSRLGPLLLDYWAAAAREPEGGSLTASITGMLQEYRSVLLPVLEEGIAEKKIRPVMDIEILASFVQTATSGFIMRCVLERKDKCVRQELDEFINCLILSLSVE